jgi:hypothetical protein
MFREMKNSSATIKIAFLDTCVASAVANGELSPADSAAFATIADAVARSDVTLWASTVMKREMDRIPAHHRARHLAEYNALRKVTAAPTTNWIDDRPNSSSFGQPTVHPTFKALAEMLPDRTDAELIYQAKANGVSDFITVDEKTILNRATEIRTRVGVNVYSPAEYVARVLGPTT